MLLLYVSTRLTATDQGEVDVFVSMKARKFETGEVFRNMSDLKEQSNHCSHLLRALIYCILVPSSVSLTVCSISLHALLVEDIILSSNIYR